MIDHREILRLHSLGISQRSISSTLRYSRNTVSKVVQKAKTLNLEWPLDSSMTNHDIEKLFYPKTVTTERAHPDWEKVHSEYLKRYVTLKLLWMEYCDQTKDSKDVPMMYTQFCHYYREHVQKKRAVMHIGKKPGETIEVDWAGQTMPIVDRDTGEIHQASIFVAVLPYSQYTFAKAYPREDLACWIEAHANMYTYFGGISRILVPDNLKTGVDRIEEFIPVMNKTYQEMAEHYGTAIIPTRVKRPQDKPSVERAVQQVSNAILAALRNHKFFSLNALNEEIQSRLVRLNEKPFHKKEGSRLSLFLEEEKPFLAPLPATLYELAHWKSATVQFNYHIQLDKMHYSVPYEYIKHKVDVRVTKNIIEVFFNQNRIASHVRLYGRAGQYSTTENHMPEDHQKYLSWNKARFIAWAEKIGEHTAVLTRSLIESFRVEQQAYRSCMGLLKLSEKYSPQRLEAACEHVLSFTSRPSLKSVKNVLSSNQDKAVTESKKSKDQTKHGFTRGAQYYGEPRS